MKEKDQNIHDQAMLITKLTSKIETGEEASDVLKETLRIAQHELHSESERFHVKLTESQKYFEETLNEVKIQVIVVSPISC